MPQLSFLRWKKIVDTLFSRYGYNIMLEKELPQITVHWGDFLISGFWWCKVTDFYVFFVMYPTKMSKFCAYCVQIAIKTLFLQKKTLFVW
jgi:hypothetical protein